MVFLVAIPMQRKTAEAVGDFRKTPIYIVGMLLSFVWIFFFLDQVLATTIKFRYSLNLVTQQTNITLSNPKVSPM